LEDLKGKDQRDKAILIYEKMLDMGPEKISPL